MRLSAFAFLFGIGKSQEIDLSGIDLSGIDLSGIDLSGIDLSQVGQICEPTDGDFKSTIDGIKDVIGKIDGPLTNLMMNPDFGAFTLIDTMKISEALIKNVDKIWCNKVFSAISSGLQSEVTMQQIENLTRDLVGTIMSILRSLGVNPQVGRLVAMAELEKEFVLGNADLKGLFPDDFRPTIEGIVSSIDFNYEYTASTANLDECGVMDEILPWVETVKPLVVGLISDFNDAFRGKEGLLSIGKMAFFDYRLAKHLLFNKSACQKLIDGASGVAAEIENVDLASIIDPKAVSGILAMIPRDASATSMTSDMMKIVGDFVKSETPPSGAKKLTYDIHKMSQIGKTAMEAAPKMMMTIKTKAGPIMEKAGMPQNEINAIMDAIKEEDVKSFASQMSAELEKSSDEMICGGQSTCEELVSFKAQVEKENEGASGLPGNGSGKTILSFGATFLTIISLIYA